MPEYCGEYSEYHLGFFCNFSQNCGCKVIFKNVFETSAENLEIWFEYNNYCKY